MGKSGESSVFRQTLRIIITFWPNLSIHQTFPHQTLIRVNLSKFSTFPPYGICCGFMQLYKKKPPSVIICSYCSYCVEQLKEFATRLEASGVTLDDINDEGADSTAEAVDQAIYQSSAHLLSMFLEKLVI